jgi:hypothetical protein
MARDKALPLSKKGKKLQKQRKEAKKPLAFGRVLIVCEGEKTEPNYFKCWQKQLENIRREVAKLAAKLKAVIDVNSFGDEIEVKVKTLTA